ncbi:MAG: M14 family murein peptide amidase A [Pseudomonadales bacterium]
MGFTLSKWIGLSIPLLLCFEFGASVASAQGYHPRSRVRVEAPKPAPPVKSPVDATCERIAKRLASVALEDCVDSVLASSGATSHQGTPILVGEFPPASDRKPLGRVLVFGGIHGDEFSSVSIVFKWLTALDNYHSGLFHWRIVPLLNPDGLLRAKSQRMNDRGVDLNRNFPAPNWSESAEEFWIRKTARNPRRYPGPAPLSEPESRWLADEIDRFDPSVIIAVHAPIHLVDFDGPAQPPQKLGPLQLRLMGTYPGSLGRYAGVSMGRPVVTIELPHAGIMPTPTEQETIWSDLVAWLSKTALASDEFAAEVATNAAIGASGGN